MPAAALRARAARRGADAAASTSTGRGVTSVGEAEVSSARRLANHRGRALSWAPSADAILPGRTPARDCHAWREQDIPDAAAAGAHAEGARAASAAPHAIPDLPGPERHLVRGRAWRVLRNRGPQRQRQEHAAQVHRAGSTACDGDIWCRGRLSTFIELGVGFNMELAARTTS